MNAQEALDELKTTHIYEVKSYFGNNKFTIEQDKDAVEAIQQLIDQSNAKPKKLEEFGWELVANDEYVERYTKKCALPFLRIDIYKKSKEFAIYSIFGNDIQPYFSLSYEEILAIAEKMKELGMTGEQIAKGER